MTHTDAIDLALDALQAFMQDSPRPYDALIGQQAIDALRAALAQPAQEPRRLTDAEIGEVWFNAKIPGMTETAARALIRAMERRMGVQ